MYVLLCSFRTLVVRDAVQVTSLRKTEGQKSALHHNLGASTDVSIDERSVKRTLVVYLGIARSLLPTQ